MSAKMRETLDASEDATRAHATKLRDSRLRLPARRPALLALLVVLLAVFYFAGVPRNPPGFFVDESSIAYNALLIAREGADEHGERWPLFFRAFGEYKSPVYIYLLSAVFKLTGASITAARALSASVVLLAALVLGILAARITRRRETPGDVTGETPRTEATLTEAAITEADMAGMAVCLAAALTPWLFELSRLVFEVALLPLVVALFLLLLYETDRRGEWTWMRSLLLGLLLGLVTYTYSVGRLLAPLYALGLLIFAVTRGRWRGVIRTWFVYGLSLLPLFVFSVRHPSALGARFYDVTFIKPSDTWAQILWGFLKNFSGNFSPLSWLVRGDPEPRHHIPFMGSMLIGTFILGLVGLVLVLGRRRRDAWWLFVLYGLAASAVPSALTLDHFHTLRLAAVPVFFLVLVAPAVAWLLKTGGARPQLRRKLFAVLLAVIILQAGLFRWRFQQEAPRRWHNFDTFYPEVFAAAVAQPQRPIYILDAHAAPGYMHAYWYSALHSLDKSQFIRLPAGEKPPAGSLVISTETPCDACRLLLHRGSFRAFIQEQ